MGRLVLMVTFGCCSLACLLLVGMSLQERQLGTVFLFATVGLLFGSLCGSMIKHHLQEKGVIAGLEHQQVPSVTFVPHWFLMTALLVTAVLVVGSILWRLVR